MQGANADADADTSELGPGRRRAHAAARLRGAGRVPLRAAGTSTRTTCAGPCTGSSAGPTAWRRPTTSQPFLSGARAGQARPQTPSKSLTKIDRRPMRIHACAPCASMRSVKRGPRGSPPSVKMMVFCSALLVCSLGAPSTRRRASGASGVSLQLRPPSLCGPPSRSGGMAWDEAGEGPPFRRAGRLPWLAWLPRFVFIAARTKGLV